jgi:uncharacterized protein
MTSEEIVFSSDGVVLRGTLTLPKDGSPCPAVVVAHGAQAGSRDYFLYRHLARVLGTKGVGTFRFDRRGEGASGGEADASFDQLARDVGRATAAVASHPAVNAEAMGLWGLSQGGWITVLSAIQGPPIAALVVVSGTPVTPARQMNHAVAEILRRRGYSDAVVEEALELRAVLERAAKGEGRAYDVKRLLDEARGQPWFGDAWIPPLEELDWTDMDLDVTPLIPQLRIPTLLLFGELDPWIPVTESIAIWRSAASSSLDLSIETISGVGHEMVAGDPLSIPTEGRPALAYEERLTAWICAVLG